MFVTFGAGILDLIFGVLTHLSCGLHVRSQALLQLADFSPASHYDNLHVDEKYLEIGLNS